MKKEHFNESFTKRYVLAVFIIAFLSTSAFTILHFAIKSSDSTAFIVNLSGKQRMLSQRIASLSTRYQTISASAFLKTTLHSSIEEMRNANEALSSGKITPNVHVTLSEQMHTLYFGPTSLHKRVEEYLALAQQLIQTTSATHATQELGMLLALSDALLPDLDKAVEQYQKEGEAHILMIKNLEIGAWILTLVVLLLEIIFIFQPMAHAIKELFQKAVWQNHELEQQVRIRTLDLEQSNLKLSHLASHDPLTGLKNRLHMEEVLERLMLHNKVNHLPFGVAMFDIDWFKKINDDYGHDAGDFVLCELAKIFSTTTRHEDTIFRSGGEEFVIVFSRIKLEDLMACCELLRQRVEQYCFIYKKVELKITISGGVYHPDELEAHSIREILNYADTALYKAKEKGRNKIILAHKVQADL